MGNSDTKPLPDRATALRDFICSYDKWLLDVNNELNKESSASTVTDSSLLTAVKSVLQAQKRLKDHEADFAQIPFSFISSKPDSDSKSDSDAAATKWAFDSYSHLRSHIMNATRYASDEKRISVEDMLHELLGKEAKMGVEKSVVDLNDARWKSAAATPIEVLLVDSRVAWIDGTKFWYHDPVHGKLDFPSLESMLLPFHKRIHQHLNKQVQQFNQLTEEQGYNVLVERLVIIGVKAAANSKRIIAVSIVLYSGTGDMVAGVLRYLAKSDGTNNGTTSNK